jgi:3-oxoadipate enol-lactonase
MPFVTSRGTNLHYETLGSGPAILMVHGFTNHGLVWAGQIADLLYAGYQVILVDLAGHGLSQPAAQKLTIPEMARDMIALLDHLKIERTAVCGLSLGGMIAQIIAVDFSSRVGPIVVANSCADCTAPETVKEIDSWVGLFEQPDGPVKRLQTVWPRMLNDAFRASPSGAAFLASWIRIVAKIPGSSFANVARGLREFNSTDGLNKVRTPCLVISSEFDKLFPPAMCKQVSDLIPNSRFTVIEGGSHLSSLDSPKPFNDLLLEFFKDQRW